MKLIKLLVLVGFCTLLAHSPLWADGNETLGPPSLTVAEGTGIVAAGTGMLILQTSTITVEVPLGAEIKQVLLYWEGMMTSKNVPGDNTILVNSNPVTGTLIGGASLGTRHSTFRADITDLGLIGDGTTVLTVSDLSFSLANNGAGIIVIYDDGSSDAFIDLRDGSDFAYHKSAEPFDTTVAQTFTFPASAASRTASLSNFFASVSGTASGGGFRPTAIEITTAGGVSPTLTVLPNLLDSNNGQEWDTLPIYVDVPAGATSLTVQPFSRDDQDTGQDPASFVWLASAFALEPEVPSALPGRMTGGGSVFTVDGVRVTRGFEIHCDLREPNNIEVNWSRGKFHMTELTSAVCTDSPAIDQRPPRAPFDTFTGTGFGKYKGKSGARIEFVFVDAGEPGKNDTASIKIFYPADNPNPVLDVFGYLKKGNIQAHKDMQSTL